MRLPPVVAAASLLSACGPSAVPLPVAGNIPDAPIEVEALPVVPPVTEAGLLTERVGAEWAIPLETCTSLASLEPHRLLCVRDGAAWRVDESGPTELWLAEASTVAGVHARGEDWVALDGELMRLVDGELFPLDLGISVPIESMTEAGGSVWLQGAGRLFEVTEAAVHELKVEGVDAIRTFAATADHLYLATPGLLALERTADGWEGRWQSAAPVDSLAVDGEGQLWFLAEGELHRTDPGGSAQVVELPAPVDVLVGAGEDLWFVGEGVVWRRAGQGFTEHALSVEGELGVDDLGRLLQTSSEGVVRASVGRPVAVVGLPESLEVQREVQLLPSDPTSLTGLSAWVDQQAVEVETAPFRLVLDPEQLDGGSHELRFLSESEQGDHLSTWPLWVGELPATTWDDIQPISEAHCLSCHGGDTVTRLQNADDWQVHIGAIIALVSSEEMPLGGPPLSDDAIIRIRAWKHGGFE